jgi:hypothetical protein
MANNKLNVPICATSYGNVGYGDCTFDPGKIVGAIQVPSSFEISQSDIDSGLLALLETKTHAAIGTRIFPYHNFKSVADNTEDVTINTSDYGGKQIVRDGFYDFTFRYYAGGIGLHQEIAKNAGNGKYFLFYDDNGYLFGRKSGTVLKGIPVDVFYVQPWRINTGADVAGYFLRFIIDPVYMNKGNFMYVKIDDFNLVDVEGLQEYDLFLFSLAGNVAKVTARSRISGVDMYDAYSTNLAQITAWKARDENNIDITITTVVVDAANKAWTITFNSTLFNAADKVYLKGAPAATMNAAPISVSGFEAKDELEIEGPQS